MTPNWAISDSRNGIENREKKWAGRIQIEIYKFISIPTTTLDGALNFTSLSFICVFVSMSIFSPHRNRGGVTFSLQFGSVCVCLCLSVCLSVCLSICLSVCLSSVCLPVGEQNASQTDAPIWTQFSLNDCLPYWLRPYLSVFLSSFLFREFLISI